MNGNQQDPNMMCEVFILAAVGLIDGCEIPANASDCARWLDAGRGRSCSGPHRDWKDPILKPTG
jgi:hypothetical protein